MKKYVVAVFLLLCLCLLDGCTCGNNNGQTKAPSCAIARADVDVLSQTSVFIPNLSIPKDNKASLFYQLPFNGFHITDVIGDRYFGDKVSFSNSNSNDTESLLDKETGKLIGMDYPKDLKQWVVSAGSYVVLQNRYLYEWRSYTSQFNEKSPQDLKLTRVDSLTGKVEIIDELKQDSPFVYLVKINEDSFLSYSINQIASNKTAYGVLSSASVYQVNGGKKEIIHEVYENDISWDKSEGILIERFAVKDGEIFGVGRRKVSGAYQFFLYHYSRDGVLVKEQQIKGLSEIIDEEQPLQILIRGDYWVIQTYESLTHYLCKMTADGVEVLVKGDEGQVICACSESDIFFMESNVDANTDFVKDGVFPLYILDTKSEKMYVARVSFPLKNPYFVGLKVLSDGSILLSYCENGAYDPEHIIQYICNAHNIQLLKNSLK